MGVMYGCMCGVANLGMHACMAHAAQAGRHEAPAQSPRAKAADDERYEDQRRVLIVLRCLVAKAEHAHGSDLQKHTNDYQKTTNNFKHMFSIIFRMKTTYSETLQHCPCVWTCAEL